MRASALFLSVLAGLAVAAGPARASVARGAPLRGFGAGHEGATQADDRAAQAGGRGLRSLSGSSASEAPSRTEEAARRALEAGLDWLAARQRGGDAGALSVSGAREPAPVAVNALAALAWMAGGSTPERGPHGRELAQVIDWLVSRTELDPQAKAPGYIARQGDTLSRMHGHGFATLALAQAYAMSPSSERGARVARALAAAVACIERTQGVEGGWWYLPEKGLSHEGSITIALVQALRAAENAGVHVQPTVVARALDYVARSQKPNGSFRYALGDEYSTLALTAAAISTLQAGGEYSGQPVEDGYVYLFRGLASREARGRFDLELGLPEPPSGGEPSSEFPEGDSRHPYCYFYERLYVAQALWQNADAKSFDEWSAKERARVLGSQRPDGSWRDPRYGDTYATAVNALFLALPEGLLPIFQR